MACCSPRPRFWRSWAEQRHRLHSWRSHFCAYCCRRLKLHVQRVSAKTRLCLASSPSCAAPSPSSSHNTRRCLSKHLFFSSSSRLSTHMMTSSISVQHRRYACWSMCSSARLMHSLLFPKPGWFSSALCSRQPRRGLRRHAMVHSHFRHW